MWSKELQETTREMLESGDFMPVMPLAKNWKGGGIPFGLALKHQQMEAGKKAGYLLASEMNGRTITVRDCGDHSVMVRYTSVEALIDAGWATD